MGFRAYLSRFAFFFTLFLAFSISHAAPAPNVPANWQAHLKALLALTSFELQGKIALKSADDAGSGTLLWKQRNHHYAILLIGPFAGNSLNLSGRPGQIVLKTGKGKEVRASSPEALLAKEWGYRLPVSRMLYWIRGIPAPQVPIQQMEFDSHHHLSKLIQQGTEIRFMSYTSGQKLDLPTKIFIHSADLETKIVIYQWKYQ